MRIKKIIDKYKIGFPTMDIESSSAMLFHENSKLSDIDAKVLGQKISVFLLPEMLRNISRPIKAYPYAKLVELPKPIEIKDSFHQLIIKRKSTRHFFPYKLSLEEISTLLYYSYGTTWHEIVYNEIEFKHRTVPSAGGLYPIELYLLVFNSEIESGLYHYRSDIHSLEYISDKFKNYKDVSSAFYIDYTIDTENVSAIMLFTIFFERIMLKYGDRGYRFAVMEAGFISQNLYLTAEALNLGVCLIGGYNDYIIDNEILNLNPNFESVINAAVLGKMREDLKLNE